MLAANTAVHFWVSVAESSGFCVIALHLCVQLTNETLDMFLFVRRRVLGSKLQLRACVGKGHIGLLLSWIYDAQRNHTKTGQARDEEVIAAAGLHKGRH